MQPIPLPSLDDAYKQPILATSQVGLHKFLWGDIFWVEDGPKAFMFSRLVNKKTPFQYANTEAFKKLVGHARHIVDCGANVGLMAVQYSRIADKVSCFEPTPSTAEMLAKNLIINNCHNCDVYQCGLHQYDGQSNFVEFNDHYGINGLGRDDSHLSTKRNSSKCIQIDVKRLDSFGFTDVDGIKIDCEGAEWHILNGAEETILRCKPIVQVEIMETTLKRFKVNGKSLHPQDVYDWFTSKDFVPLNNKLQKLHPTTWSYIRNHTDLFFVHKDAPVLDRLFPADALFVWG